MTSIANDGRGFRSWQIGKVSVTRIDEQRFSTAASDMLAGATDEQIDRNRWLRPHFMEDDGRLKMSIHSFVLRSEGRLIMIDTCVGNDKPRAYPQLDNLQTPYFDDLRAAGFEPDQFDTVLCTHMHVDHVGWNTRWVDGRWVPTFPNARYLFSRAEWEHCEATPDISPGDFMRDSVAPLVEAGLHMIVEGDHHITSEVWLVPTPGHTPGHVSVRISSAGQDALITGDMIHHPIQCSEPSLSSHFDHDADRARDTREKLLASCCDQDILILGTHFADPTGGRLIAGAGGRRLVVDEP